MEVLDTSVERPSSFVEHSPVLPEEQGQILQQNKSGATNSKEGSETLNDPLNKTIHPPETLPYSYSTSTSAGAPGIQENLHLPPVSQLQGFDTSGLLCLDPEELTDMSLSRGDQNQPLHDLQGFSRSKPALPNYPPIWAQSRQEVCESFDWFRSYQGGVYHVRDFVKGYLLSAFSSSRDLFEHDGRLIVSHGGGKAESIHSSQGKSSTQPAEDQLAQDKSIRALLANYRESRPLVLLIDDKYALFPYDLKARNVTYAVLGLYTITHAWAEYQPANNELGRVVRYKFSFQWCEGQGDPWWASHEDRPMDVCEKQQLLSCNVPMNPTLLPLTGPPVKIKEEKLSDIMPLRPDGIYIACLTCDQKTPKVYKQGWACLNPTCRQFWVTLDHGHLPLQLDYNRDFLRLTPPYSLPPNLSDIRPGRPESSLDSITTTYAFTRGLHCRKCGRLSCRDKWEYWQCMQCKDKAGVLGRLRLPKEFWNEILPDSFLDHFIHGSSGIAKGATRLFTHGNGMGQRQTFILPTGRGQIHHIQSTTPQGNSDADRIFEKYQEHMSAGRLKFRRWPMRAHKCRGPLLTNYFSHNSGEPYQYVGGTDNTVPFSKTSSAVTGARNLIQKRISQALGMNHEFNEVLSVAYMERQKMAFHSDSERGLGPVVAGLSLGSPALMHFRVHHKYLREDEIEHKPIALTVVLRHGDVLVMDGAGVQESYEHTVVPTNFRIAATARTIDAKAPKIEDIRIRDSTQAVRSGIKSELG
ncbi:hypothetical protein FPV67DRAFT_1036975 [Lyophyllum atratum]|nr:hypothetical protein FPV67DRAFT_1036975 [Lyophyllum atratum]